jgi:hypothetical protein
MEKCHALTKKGTPCSRNAKDNGFCTQHKKFEKGFNYSHKDKTKLKLPRLPENISQKLANCSQVGLNKIKEQIIQMWLEDGGSILILEKYNRRIPVASDVYQELLKIFNNEDIVLSQIFISESSIPKEPKKQSEEIPIGSDIPPKAPVNLSYYANFIPKVGKIMNEEHKKAFQVLKQFIQERWIKEGNILYNNLIYLSAYTYKNAENFFRLKIQEVTKDVDYWKNYLMSQLFRIGRNVPKPYKQETPKPKVEPKIEPLGSIRKIQYKNMEEELIKLLPDKDIKLFIEIIKINSSLYKVTTKQDIHKLYIQFHPDKCGLDPKIVKLCSAFCAKVESIKKAWEYNKNPKACSPARTRGDDTETILKILNDEI